MNFNPKVSIIVPVYNGTNYMHQAIDSALGQTYKNTEVLVINDGSNDNGATEKVALSYGKGVRYFFKLNGGVASALNLGIEKMDGEYFSWLSHDDVYYPDKIKLQINMLAKMENQEVALFCDYETIDQKNDTLWIARFDHEWLERKPLYALLRSCIHGCSLLIPKSLFDKYGVFNEKLKTTQDYALWFKMIRHERFIHQPQVLIKSRSHPEQDTIKHPETLREANELWINMMNTLTDKEILSCEQDRYTFYLKMYQFLKIISPYTEARDYALSLAKRSSILKYIIFKLKNNTEFNYK